MMSKRYIASKTLKVRNSLVKLLAPKIGDVLEQQKVINDRISRTPRPMILFAKKHFSGRQNLRGIEIGIEKAVNSWSILQELPIGQLFLIDPYIPYEDALGHADFSNDAVVAHTKLAEYPQAVWFQMKSEAAIEKFRDEEPVEFVYIDGDHSYESVKKDIMLYYPLVKNGGLIGGHDYTPYYESVMKAVNEFAEENKLVVHTVFPDWWFIK